MQMFVNDPAEPDMNRLRFLRWLAEGDHLEHPAVGPASGEYAEVQAVGRD